MGFLSGLLQLGGKALSVGGKVATGIANNTVQAATWVGGKTMRGVGKIATSKVMMKTAKNADDFSFIDKAFQNITGLAEKGADGAMQYKKLTAPGFLALAAIPMAIDTAKTLSGSSKQSDRGMVSVADNPDRFISYDGSGFLRNANDVAGGDPAVLNDIVNHTFTSQRSVLSNNSLNDIVFALHANREG